jgi:hypothetical protein
MVNRKIAIISVLLLLGVLLVASCSPKESSSTAMPTPISPPPSTESSTGPRISFDQDSVDLGGVPLDIPINYTFRFKNVGNAPLNVIGAWAKALVGC